MGEVVDQWANIHEDMLDEFTKRFHLYDDYLQLRLICKQWNFKLPKILNGNKAPWLLLPIGGGAATNEILESNSLEEKGIYHLTLPDLQDGLIRGSCYGWLIIVSMYEGTIRMLNPLTKVCLDLPPISDLPDVIQNGDECSFFFAGHSMITEETILANKFLVWKVIINSAPDDINFMAVVLYGSCRLAFYKSSNRRWLKLPTRPRPYFQDVIFFQQKIYAIQHDGQLYEFDTMTKAEPVVRIFKPSTPFDTVTKDINQKYLIGTADGTLLMVVRHLINLICEEEERYYKTTRFDIYELKKDSNAWSRISSLGNYILVIGFNASVKLFAGDLLNSKGNQIYFTDSLVQEQSMVETYYHNIGIFNLEDGSCQDVLSDVNFFCPPVWILP
ncbi:putative F-box protein At5g55150 [Arachis stenosperma]|uniref:putative F-box protein At5g55150 n=1 Tax=Arachis stenosperma TaxID=217475 RepID=UPI0025ABBBCD|nr:putative F-box protein At5g55150 [Arachis stenosperma]